MTKQDRIRTQAQLALTELRRLRDKAAESDASEAARINAVIIALRDALS